MINLGNVVGLIKSELPPAKTYVLWAKILNPAFPNVVELMKHDGTAWVPLLPDLAFDGTRAIKSLPQVGDNYNSSTIVDFIEAAFYKFINATTFFNSQGLKAVGTIANITLTGGYVANDETLFSDRVLLKDGAQLATWSGAAFSVPDSIKQTTTYQLQVTVGGNGTPVTLTQNVTVTFVFPYYHLVGAANVTAAQIQAGTQIIAAKSNRTVSFTAAAQRIIFAVPKIHGKLVEIRDPTNADVLPAFLTNDGQHREMAFQFPVNPADLAEGYFTQDYYVYINNADFTASNYTLIFKATA